VINGAVTAGIVAGNCFEKVSRASSATTVLVLASKTCRAGARLSVASLGLQGGGANFAAKFGNSQNRTAARLHATSAEI
jgi:hypothetical protein